MGPEAKLYQKLKTKTTPRIIWNRIENLSILGMPDLLGYNNSGHFFTVELKITRANKLKFSPHQIAWHVAHPRQYIYLSRGPRSEARETFSVVHGSGSLRLVALSLKLVAWGLRLATCYFGSLGA